MPYISRFHQLLNGHVISLPLTADAICSKIDLMEKSDSNAHQFTTRELSNETLPDFEKLLASRPAPGAFTCWCMYNHEGGPSPKEERLLSNSERADHNRREKRRLVARGRSHGIIVYEKGEPVGWCQFGLAEELPRIDNNPGYGKIAPEPGRHALWRITCFVVPARHRGHGVASVALKAALEAIRARGGGLIEAYPIRQRGAYQEYRGTLSMFKQLGFEIVGPISKDNLLVRKTV